MVLVLLFFSFSKHLILFLSYRSRVLNCNACVVRLVNSYCIDASTVLSDVDWSWFMSTVSSSAK